MKRVILVVVATLGLSCASALPSLAQSGPDESARQMAALKRDVDKLKTETAALKKQIEELKKVQGDLNGHVDMLLKHRHQLFVDSMRADSFFPKAKGTFFVITPSPDDLTKTSGPVSGPGPK